MLGQTPSSLGLWREAAVHYGQLQAKPFLGEFRGEEEVLLLICLRILRCSIVGSGENSGGS